MQLSFNCGYPVATTNFKMHGQANRIYAILHLMKQILISIHINRELYALRFELIFFFCSKNLRLFKSAKIHIDLFGPCPSLFVYTWKLVQHMCTLVQHSTSTVRALHKYCIQIFSLDV